MELKFCRTLSVTSPSPYLKENVNGLPSHAARLGQIQTGLEFENSWQPVHYLTLHSDFSYKNQIHKL